MIKYIDNNKNHGIKYDFKLIEKEVKKLGLIPDGMYNPFNVHELASGRYFADFSERSIGKTTAWLLIGMCMRRLYENKPQIIYIRQIVDMILPKNASQLFATILAHDYVSKITDGKYNSIRYRSRGHYYYNTETMELDDEPFMVSIGCDEWADKKSSFNAPYGDIIIFDEAIGKQSYQDEFVHFMDLIKTTVRERDSAFVVILANTINKNAQLFLELEIFDTIQNIKVGERRLITTKGGTIIDLALIGSKLEDMPSHRREHNRKFFAFNNPKLNAIRGGEWAGKVYPHVPKLTEVSVISRNRYIRHNGALLNLELLFAKELGLFVKVHLSRELKEDSIVYSLDNTIDDSRTFYKWAKTPLDDKLKELLADNKWYYATNTEGALIDDYIKLARSYDRFL